MSIFKTSIYLKLWGNCNNFKYCIPCVKRNSGMKLCTFVESLPKRKDRIETRVSFATPKRPSQGDRYQRTFFPAFPLSIDFSPLPAKFDSLPAFLWTLLQWTYYYFPFGSSNGLLYKFITLKNYNSSLFPYKTTLPSWLEVVVVDFPGE